jgi:hypothetical protein
MVIGMAILGSPLMGTVRKFSFKETIHGVGDGVDAIAEISTP